MALSPGVKRELRHIMATEKSAPAKRAPKPLTKTQMKGLAASGKAHIKAVADRPSLKPCRFCKLKTVYLETGMASLGFFVRCDNARCKAAGPRRPTEVEALDAWNI